MESSESGILKGGHRKKSERWSRQLWGVLAHSGPTVWHPCESAGPPLGDRGPPSS